MIQSRILCRWCIYRLHYTFETMDIYTFIYYKPEESALPKPLADLIVYSCFLMLFTVIYALLKQKYDIAFIVMLIFITSIHYWNNPTYGIRRYIDMTTVIFGFLYIFYRALRMRISSPLFWGVYLFTILLYPFGRYLFHKKYVKISTYVHCFFHLCGNASAVLFCSL